MSNKPQFASKIGLIAATVGSAVGLGNIWRFPAEAQSNGGAAFLLIYIVCVFVLGVPVMSAEFTLGRAGRSDAIGAFKNTGGRRNWWLTGALAILTSYFILWFYSVVAGWTIEYFWQSLTGNLYQTTTSGIGDSNALFNDKMNEYIAEGNNALLFTYIAILANLIILIIGVQKGIERISNILMPLLFLILVIFCFVSLTLPNAREGLSFFLKPDFSKLTPGVVINALGQAFFSLSLGMGILITYSSYFPKKTKLAKTAVTVSLLDLLVAFMMGIIIFPAVKSFQLEQGALEGTKLIFITLPEIFEKMGFTLFWSTLFFLLLTVAALTSTISIAEVTIAFLQDRFKMKRVSACLTAILPLFLFSSLCALSQGPLSDIKILGMTIFDFLDSLTTNIMLPIGSFLLCIYLGWYAPKRLLKDELSNYGTVKSVFHNVIYFIVKYLAPLLIGVVFISGFID